MNLSGLHLLWSNSNYKARKLVKCGPPKLAGPVRLHCSHSPKATTDAATKSEVLWQRA